ncbi:type VI secretion system baseplate subunit TssG [Rhodoferax aquaticus]|uniref:Type VI secretion system baseplate subunit TssG n=1 Tax=Rhodoferax aquaticus TaxID=2527691 RepID=A0A515EPS3_9BURK|nr:type VI secretion system baseplate subunit TssG [Rhodoferax aquaticus]QDL54671.1 type VI secretion system baseplate subunit TssG [Rhodoferax aquaticus]
MKPVQHNTLQDAQARPWAHGFMPLLRRLSAWYAQRPRVGQAERPQQEPYRLGQQASLTFAVREIASVHTGPSRTHIKLFGLGSLGPNGSLPIHVTELVRERVEAKRDTTLADFLDLFHHRAFTHFYRAWAQSQSAAGLDRPAEETFTPYIARLGADEPSQVQHSALAPHARWASVAHRVRAPRNPEGLIRTLSHYFGVPVRMQEFCLQWMPLEPQDLCQLGRPLQSSLLGQGAVIGEVVPDRQSRFRLIIGPLDLPGYLRLTPQGAPRPGSVEQATTSRTAADTVCDLGALIELVRSFIGFEYVWEVELLVDRQAAPASTLGGTTPLGWSSWLGGSDDHVQGHKDKSSQLQSALRDPQSAISGMVLEPEHYASQLLHHAY